jgi:1-acyl-sn-glycerol-3-phosphate acyltransferase
LIVRSTHPAVRLFRFSRLKLHFLLGALTALLVLPLLPGQLREKRILAWCRKLLSILNIRVETFGLVPDQSARGTLFVANHISWLDIYALKQLLPMHFVAKSEIRSWPVIGWLASVTGTVFIERERRHDTGRVLNTLEQALQRNECVCLFPEGTTTDGTTLHPFKSSLFQAAINANATVWPVAIRYPEPDGNANTAIAYHGETTLWQSLKEVLKQREIVVELHFSAPRPAQGMERRHLSHQARHAISSSLHLKGHRGPGIHDDPPDASH